MKPDPVVVKSRTPQNGRLSPIWVKCARIVMGLRSQDLAAKLGVGSARMSRLENGRDLITPEMEKRILKILEVD